MELFHENGHLTDEGLRAVMEETLNEMQRLEVAEHLSFCDDCLLRYSNLLSDDILHTPANPIAPPVLSRIRRHVVQIFFNKYTTAAAAAAFALVLWGTGVFANAIPVQTPRDYTRDSIKAPVSASVKVNSFFRSVSESINDALANLTDPFGNGRAGADSK